MVWSSWRVHCSPQQANQKTVPKFHRVKQTLLWSIVISSSFSNRSNRGHEIWRVESNPIYIWFMMDLTCDSTRGRDSSHKQQLNADGLSSQNEPIVSSWLESLCYNSSKAFEPIGHHVYQLLLPALSTLHIQTEGDAHFLLNICLKNQSIPMPTIVAVFTMCRSGTQDTCKST
jgi:hypothetical protein